MAALLILGMVCNLFVRPVAPKSFMSDEQLARERALQHEDTLHTTDAAVAARGPFGSIGVLAWLAVGVPFLIGLFIALKKAAALV
jgi:hypothetical protein